MPEPLWRVALAAREADRLRALDAGRAMTPLERKHRYRQSAENRAKEIAYKRERRRRLRRKS